MTEAEVLQAIEEAKKTRAVDFSLPGEGLTSLPPEIGQLTNITRLNLKDNKLTELPTQIGQLTQLKRIYLTNNKLTNLPSEIGNLQELEILYASNNKLTSLPPEIGQLSGLQSLYLRDNCLESLPQELQQLTNLKNLDLRKNPLSIPEEIIETIHKPASIVKFYLEYQEVKEANYNTVKTILVGPSGVGKTTLAKLLQGKPFNKKHVPTTGLNIHSWTAIVDNAEIEVRLWDFGSVENMHIIYQCGFSSGSVYILVTDPYTPESQIEYWLKMILGLAKSAPIILLGNKIDQGFWQINRSKLVKQYPNIIGFLEVSCLNQEGLTLLQDMLTRTIANLDSIKQQVSPNWITVSKHLEVIEPGYLDWEKYSQLCQGEVILQETEQEKLANSLADIGIIIYPTNHPVLKDKTIANPEWLIDNLYKILNDYRFQVQTKGIINSQTLKDFLELNHRDQGQFLLYFLVGLELALPNSENSDCILPHLIKVEPVTGDWQDSDTINYQYNVLLPSIVPRLIARLHKYLEKDSCWQWGAVFSNRDNRALVQANSENSQICISVSGKAESRSDFAKIIVGQLEKIHRTTPGIQATKAIPTSESPTGGSESVPPPPSPSPVSTSSTIKTPKDLESVPTPPPTSTTETPADLVTQGHIQSPIQSSTSQGIPKILWFGGLFLLGLVLVIVFAL